MSAAHDRWKLAKGKMLRKQQKKPEAPPPKPDHRYKGYWPTVNLNPR